MPIFKIVPTDCLSEAIEITANDAGGVLHVVEQLDCREADVLQDGAYSFSVRLSDNGLWSISQRDQVSDGPIDRL